MLKLLRWFDENLLAILSAFLLVFIPLYPKLPLFEALPGYIVRVRLEDFVISFTLIIWFIWLLRGKITLSKNPLLKPILAYLLVGLLSLLSAIFIIGTVPKEWLHVNKIFLHYVRRIEYFSLFFIFYSSIKSLRQLKIFITLFVVTILGIVLYGFGQKYLYWPAFSTMNREFSKGWVLYLTEHARVLSTFGGHYDLAAYIMGALIFLWSIFFSIRRIIWRIPVFLVLAGAFWTLILTASRTSFLAYLFGVTFMFFFWAYKRGLKWSVSRWFFVVTLSVVIMLSFGDLSERFTKLLRIDERVSGIKSLLLSPIGKPPTDKAFFLENNPNAIADITSKSDQPPTPLRPDDVFEDIPLLIPVSTGSATVSAVSRTYSKTAFMYDLSTAIRFDALWPMAMKGFWRNPLLGSGYANLNKTQDSQFTEAESTDNDFLRALGETGLLGFVTFYGILAVIIFIIWRNLMALRSPLVFGSSVALGGFIFGLLANAAYIDVFESSKVALSFWGLTGLVLAGIKIETAHRLHIAIPGISDLKDMRKRTILMLGSFIRGNLFPLLLILSLSLWLRTYKINTPLADWHSWRQADTSSVTRNFVKHGVNFLYPTYDDLSNVASGQDNPKGLRFVEFPIYNFVSVITDKIFVGFNIEVSGRLTSIFAALGSITFLYLLVKKYSGKKEAILTGLLYGILPYNIYYTRVILPEPFLVFSTLGMIYFFDKTIERVASLSGKPLNAGFIVKTAVTLFIALLFTSVSLLVKPFAAFLFLPMLYLWFKGLGISVKSIAGYIVFFILAFIPFVLWRYWIVQFPEGMPAYDWLLNGDNIRFKGAFFQWIFADRLGRMILGYWGMPFLFMGILSKPKKEGWLFNLWGLAMIIYVTVVATGNVRHDYYQTITIPIICIFMAKGITFISDLGGKYISTVKMVLFTVTAFIFMEMFAWYHIRDFYNINHPEIVEAGNAVERISSDKALVIAPYNGDTAFLYQTKRSGWPIIEDSIDKMIKMGAHYYVSVNFDDLTKGLIKDATVEDPLKRKYKLIEINEKYVIIQLVSDKDLPR